MSRQVDNAADTGVEERFAVVPDWLLDAEIADGVRADVPYSAVEQGTSVATLT